MHENCVIVLPVTVWHAVCIRWPCIHCLAWPQALQLYHKFHFWLIIWLPTSLFKRIEQLKVFHTSCVIFNGMHQLIFDTSTYFTVSNTLLSLPSETPSPVVKMHSLNGIAFSFLVTLSSETPILVISLTDSVTAIRNGWFYITTQCRYL